MGIRGAGAVDVLVSARRGLYEVEESSRPGRSDLAYMQHKYSPLDSRIIIITAAILLLLLAILFLNFFIHWLLRRFFLLRSSKPINPNKGLSKRQVQALPSFTYSSSLGPLPTHIKPASPPACGHPFFYPPFVSHPISSQFCHVVFPTSMIATAKDGDVNYQCPTKLEVCKGNHQTPSPMVAIQVHKVIDTPPNKGGSLEGNQLMSNHVHQLDIKPPTKPDSLKVDHALGDSFTPHKDNNFAIKDSNCTEAIMRTSVDNKEIKGDAITNCNRNHEMDKLCDEHASSISPCPICLVEFADGETIRVLPGCQHFFHIGCIDLWLAKSSSCPACRANLLDATKASNRDLSTLHVQLATSTSQ